MRQNAILALLVLCASLLAANLFLQLATTTRLPAAFSQAPAGDVLIAASNTQNEAFCFVYNTDTNQLASYRNRNVGGLDLRGIRNCKYDFTPKIDEYPRPTPDKETAVKKMKELAEKLSQGDEAVNVKGIEKKKNEKKPKR